MFICDAFIYRQAQMKRRNKCLPSRLTCKAFISSDTYCKQDDQFFCFPHTLHIFTHFFTHFCLGKPRSKKNRHGPRQLKRCIFISLLKKLLPSLDSGYELETGVGRDDVILL